MKRTAVIEVACIVDFDELDADDRLEDGNCAVDGSHAVLIEDIPAGTTRAAFTGKALDIFHARVPIARLEDFSIIARLANSQDDISSMHQIGPFRFDEDVFVATGIGAGAGSDLPVPTPGGTTDPFDPTAIE